MRKEIDGVLVQVAWVVENGEAILKTAYPVCGEGVMEVHNDKLVEPTSPFNEDKFFLKGRQ